MLKNTISLEASVEGYFKMMASGYAYGKFRKARVTEQNPFKLISHLTHYSELRSEYVKRLYHVMRSNRFYRLDTPSFQPLALNEILPKPQKKHADRDSQVAKSVMASVESSLVPLNEVIYNGAAGPDVNATLIHSDLNSSIQNSKSPSTEATRSVEL